MKKRMIVMLIIVGILFAGIFGFHALMAIFVKRYMASQSNPTITVSAMKIDYSPWQSQLKASGSLRAIRGVNVTTELAGMVQTIYFTPGAMVNQGTVLVQLNADNDIAALNSLEANAELALVTYTRDRSQFEVHAISKQTLDNDAANLKSLRAQVAQQAAIVKKKTIVVPFKGRLGISAVNPGQFINPGDKVVNLQMLDPIYADFYMPQQTLGQFQVGMPVTVTSETFPGKIFKGKITTIEPSVDVATRNVEVEATLQNPNYQLTPGMFATVTITTGAVQRYLTLPQTAISFNPYGEIAYLIRQSKEKDKKGQPILIAKQAFVVTGETRGDQITVLKGIKAGDIVVTSGQLKLKNGSPVRIDNSIVPQNEAAPYVPNEY